MRSRQRRILILNPDFIDFLKSINNTVSWPTDETSGDVLLASNPAVAEGRDIVINGGFDTDTDWTKGTGWTIAAGVASCDGTQLGNSDLAPTITIPLAVAATYNWEYTLSNHSGGVFRFFIGNTVVSTVAANGTYTGQHVLTGGSSIICRGDVDFIGDIDNVSVKQVNIAASSTFSTPGDNPFDADVTGAAITPTSGVSFPYYRLLNGSTNKIVLDDDIINSVLDPTDFSIGIAVLKTTWDTTERDFFSLDVDANNYIRCTDTTTAGTIQYEIKAGGISETIPHLTGSPTGWFMIDLTVTGGNLIASFNGAVVGTPQAVAGTFTGNLTSAVIGARTTTPTFVHLGGLSVPYMGMLRSFTQKEKLTIAQKAGVV